MDDPTLVDIKQKMLKSLEVTKSDLATIRTGRATPALVENVLIIAYGGSQKLKIKELATITTADAKTLLVTPFDPSTKEDMVKGILEANVGLNPVAEGEHIRITIPALSAERRGEYLKLARAKLEAGRVMLRQVRHEEMSKLKRDFVGSIITEDDKKRLEKHLQELTDEMMVQIDAIGTAKEKELMQI
jgi:ribosome recycling factor